MSFILAAFCYIVALILSCFLIFFSILQVRAFYVLKLKQFDENTYIFLYILLNLIVLPDYISHVSLTLLFLCSGEWLTFLLNVPLVAYHVYRYKTDPVKTRFVQRLHNTTLMEPELRLLGGSL